MCDLLEVIGVPSTFRTSVKIVYYESLKRELKTKTIYGFRCDERAKKTFLFIMNR